MLRKDLLGAIEKDRSLRQTGGGTERHDAGGPPGDRGEWFEDNQTRNGIPPEHLYGIR